jgi:hypothetical protein
VVRQYLFRVNGEDGRIISGEFDVDEEWATRCAMADARGYALELFERTAEPLEMPATLGETWKIYTKTLRISAWKRIRANKEALDG